MRILARFRVQADQHFEYLRVLGIFGHAGQQNLLGLVHSLLSVVAVEQIIISVALALVTVVDRLLEILFAQIEFLTQRIDITGIIATGRIHPVERRVTLQIESGGKSLGGGNELAQLEEVRGILLITVHYLAQTLGDLLGRAVIQLIGLVVGSGSFRQRVLYDDFLDGPERNDAVFQINIEIGIRPFGISNSVDRLHTSLGLREDELGRHAVQTYVQTVGQARRSILVNFSQLEPRSGLGSFLRILAVGLQLGKLLHKGLLVESGLLSVYGTGEREQRKG